MSLEIFGQRATLAHSGDLVFRVEDLSGLEQAARFGTDPIHMAVGGARLKSYHHIRLGAIAEAR
ncbi:hypothetical protein TI01_1023 [Lysobacter sp. A03]|nr:hypothetical protein TI01_1023 [Lysobacter sp. A03]